MSENDYIAEFIKEKYPEIILSADFALWKIGRILDYSIQKFVESFKKIDFTGLNKALEAMKKQQEGEE